MDDMLKRAAQSAHWLIGVGVFLSALMLYVGTLAPGLVFGDPAEYTFVPHIWGISHPPGYAFQTVLGGVWQRLIPLGSIAYRANLLSAVAGASIAVLVYAAVLALPPPRRASEAVPAYLPGLLAGLSSAVATDIWQHSIHANAHIISALLTTTGLFLLLRWWRSELVQGKQDNRWLYAFCVVTGFSVTHHPLLVFSFPAYGAFILTVRPNLLTDWKTLLKLLGSTLIGLSVWLYLPIRASLPVPMLFGPDNTNTISGFLDLVLARGLRVNLFHFGLEDQPARWLVFLSLLRLQASPVTLALMLVGMVWLWRQQWRVGLLFTVFLITNLVFILNTIQDVMAYLMVPLVALLMLGGIGLLGILDHIRFSRPFETQVVRFTLALTLLFIPLGRGAALAPLVSLREYDEAERWIDEVYGRFEGRGEGAILLAHWEHLTPLWYSQWVEGHKLDEADVRLVFVATTSKRPWLDNVWANLDKGPVYVSGFQRELIEAGFRLRPTDGRMYRVLPAPATDMPDMGMMLNAMAGPVTLVGVDLPKTTVDQGQVIPLNVALYAARTPEDIIFPYATLGNPGSDDLPFITFYYTTDSHFLSPWWQPGEVIVERYDLRAPLNAPPGQYPLRLGLRNLSDGSRLTFADGADTIELGTITIRPTSLAVPEEGAIMADIAHQVGLVSGAASARGQRRFAVWQEPLCVRPGDDIHIRLTWMVLAPPDDNWKVFVHLVDNANQIITQQDTPPLGGAFPTFLWFPKWVPGQTVIDPYRLTVPPDTPPGDYLIEVGLYGFTTFQRAPFFDPTGNLSGDRFILGIVRIEP